MKRIAKQKPPLRDDWQTDNDITVQKSPLRDDWGDKPPWASPGTKTATLKAKASMQHMLTQKTKNMK